MALPAQARDHDLIVASNGSPHPGWPDNLSGRFCFIQSSDWNPVHIMGGTNFGSLVGFELPN